MSSKPNSPLWQGIELPPWRPERLYELFLLHREPEGLHPVEHDEYTRLLMHFAYMFMVQKKWIGSLARANAEPDDVGQDAIQFLLRKTKSMKVDHPCQKVLIAMLNTILQRWLLSKVDESSNRKRETTATDFFHNSHEHIDRPWIDDECPGIPLPADQLGDVLRDAEESVCADIVPLSHIDIFTVVKLYRLLRFHILCHRMLPDYESLPRRLRMVVPHELHGIVSARLTRVVWKYAHGEN